MNSGHVTERVCVHVCTSGSSKGDFVLLGLLTLVVFTNTTKRIRRKLHKIIFFTRNSSRNIYKFIFV